MSTQQKSNKSGTLYLFFGTFGTFRETWSLKYDKNVGQNMAKKFLHNWGGRERNLYVTYPIMF